MTHKIKSTKLKKEDLEDRGALPRRILRSLFGLPEEMPVSLPMDGFYDDSGYTWEDWRRDMRKKYPIRFFLSRDLPMYAARAKRVFWEDPTYYLISHLHPRRRYHMLDMRSPSNGYKYGWKDRSEVMMFAAFAVLSDFVEGEYPGHVNWDHDDDIRKVKEEFLALHRWWTIERKKEHDEVDDLRPMRKPRSRWARFKAVFTEDIFRKDEPLRAKGSWRDPDEVARHEKIVAMTEALDKKDDEMLNRLIAIRRYLWT